MNNTPTRRGSGSFSAIQRRTCAAHIYGVSAMFAAVPNDLQTISILKREHDISTTLMASWKSFSPKDLALIILFWPVLLLGACLPDNIIEKIRW